MKDERLYIFNEIIIHIFWNIKTIKNQYRNSYSIYMFVFSDIAVKFDIRKFKTKTKQKLTKKGGGAENMNENKNDVAYVIFYSQILFLSKTSLNSFRYPNIPQILHFTSQCCVLPPSLHSKINGFFFCFSIKSIYWLYMNVHVYPVCLPSTVSTISTNSLIAVHWRRLRHVFKSCLMILCLF